MDGASEAEKGSVGSGKQLSEDACVNALVLLAWTTDGVCLLYGAIANIACKLLCFSCAV